MSNKSVLCKYLNGWLRGTMNRLDYMEIGRSGKYFTMRKDKIQPIDNLTMYKGFTSAFQECDKGIFLRVNTARKIVNNGTVLDAINGIYKKCQDSPKEIKRNQTKKELINSIIMTNYGKMTCYRILDIEFEKSLMEVPISADIPNLKEYYAKRYKIEVKSEKQPLLVVENKIRRRGSTQGPTYLLPELCCITVIPENFDEDRRKQISQQTILAPQEKKVEIEDFMKELVAKNEVQNLEEIGIKLNKNLNKVTAKQISNPSLELGNKKYVEKGKEANF